MSIEDIQNSIRNVPDFPQKGIQFKDITTAIKQPQIFHEIIDTLAQKFSDQKINQVVGIESRGFIFGTALLINSAAVLCRCVNQINYRQQQYRRNMRWNTATIS